MSEYQVKFSSTRTQSWLRLKVAESQIALDVWNRLSRLCCFGGTCLLIVAMNYGEAHSASQATMQLYNFKGCGLTIELPKSWKGTKEDIFAGLPRFMSRADKKVLFNIVCKEGVSESVEAMNSEMFQKMKRGEMGEGEYERMAKGLKRMGENKVGWVTGTYVLGSRKVKGLYIILKNEQRLVRITMATHRDIFGRYRNVFDQITASVKFNK